MIFRIESKLPLNVLMWSVMVTIPLFSEVRLSNFLPLPGTPISSRTCFQAFLTDISVYKVYTAARDLLIHSEAWYGCRQTTCRHLGFSIMQSSPL